HAECHIGRRFAVQASANRAPHRAAPSSGFGRLAGVNRRHPALGAISIGFPALVPLAGACGRNFAGSEWRRLHPLGGEAEMIELIGGMFSFPARFMMSSLEVMAAAIREFQKLIESTIGEAARVQVPPPAAPESVITLPEIKESNSMNETLTSDDTL